ncbi:ATP-binding protein [Candidatus Albibeggiatoa sp. nov. NOAA]|uniref:ATP-binding protein n=1 Tax=Candidatus Albibeggiatoa sp. nov. NOAA TaxID=3162724 RepID=UPI0033017086|nr:ATP-binding protein [Thiotrichaceae bacterium]
MSIQIDTTAKQDITGQFSFPDKSDKSSVIHRYPLATVESLIIPRAHVKPEHTVEKVGKMFLSHPHLQSIPVVHKKTPVGIVHRYQLMDIYLSAYGRDLHGRKPILQFMDSNPVVIEDDLPVEAASKFITQNMQFAASQDFIITHKGKYQGIGMVMDLLKKITNLQIEAYNEALAQKVDELEKRTSELSIANMQAQAANEQARAANQVKTRFLANMSHELRTPINAIVGYSEILEEEAEDMGQAFCMHDLQKIQKAGRHLLSMVSDILEATKMASENVELELSNFSFSDMLQEVADTLKPVIMDDNNTLNIECEYFGTMYADLPKVRHCLYNLLTNAAKFSKDGEILLFATHEIEEDKEWIIFGVRDQGVGMSSEQVDHLFGAFNQLDNSATRKYDGAGLGLTIVKQFCEMMGGSISVSSELNQGSQFIVRLPRNVEQTATEES